MFMRHSMVASLRIKAGKRAFVSHEPVGSPCKTRTLNLDCIDEKLLIDLIQKGLLRLIIKPEEACIQRSPKEADIVSSR